MALSDSFMGEALSACSVETAERGVGLTQVSRVAGSRLRYRAPLDADAMGDCCLERGGTGWSVTLEFENKERRTICTRVGPGRRSLRPCSFELDSVHPAPRLMAM